MQRLEEDTDPQMQNMYFKILREMMDLGLQKLIESRFREELARTFIKKWPVEVVQTIIFELPKVSIQILIPDLYTFLQSSSIEGDLSLQEYK